MEQHPLTYLEKLENLYVLLETRQMLEAKMHGLPDDSEEYRLIQKDLAKIKEEMMDYTDEKSIEQLSAPITSSLFNPAMYIDDIGHDDQTIT
ncbi:hypothetical protein SAMN05421736_12316 [Evansella caseinilytica]|uniref:Uncharacterized protein n=1 Tax=Evansella caseinilytica TaxID=1503961 RepID=A0A1H3ULE9_9BACI|nr:hypothetical protein [Evansella caseinilytica]SDZ63272.1 hypothetical protein SAMN05421736_12316 [Evansella caseinilytica]